MREAAAIYVEDVERDGRKYSGLLTEKGKLSVKSLMAPETPDAKVVLREKPDVVLIDYELTQKQKSGRVAAYRGGTLATNIRETYPFIPIVLVTRKSLLRKYEWAPGQLGPFDMSIFKDEIRSNRSRMVVRIASLASGYKSMLRSSPLNWKKIVRLLGAKASEIELLEQCRPSGSLVRDMHNWGLPELAGWVLDTIFRYPGVLYDQLYAATALGISYDSLSRKRVKEALQPAQYDGIFCEMDSRWWKSRLSSEAYRIVRKARLGPPLARSFASALKEVTGIKVEPAMCLHSGEKYADTVCYVLQKPVMYKYTLAYFPDGRPKVMDQARVSINARSKPEFRQEFLTSEGKKLIHLPSSRWQ